MQEMQKSNIIQMVKMTELKHKMTELRGNRNEIQKETYCS